MGEDIIRTIGLEFSDLSIAQTTQLALRIVVAGLLGGLLGIERGRARKAAGFRTHILVSVGAAAFVAVPLQGGIDSAGMSRILQGLIPAIGFLGAGCILKGNEEESVRGLTTAAGIWLTAAIGMAAGMGRESSAILIGLAGWFTLRVLAAVDSKLTDES